MDLIRLALDLFRAIRANDWPNIIRLLGEILPIVLGALGNQPPPVPSMSLAHSMVASKTLLELVDEAETVCNQHAPKGAAAVPQKGPIIDALKPLLGKLILMLLGIG